MLVVAGGEAALDPRRRDLSKGVDSARAEFFDKVSIMILHENTKSCIYL